MLRKPFHGWRIKQEIQKLTAVRTPPVRESPGSPTRPTPLTSVSPLPPLFFYCQNFPPTSHFRFTHQSLSTSAAYYSRAPEPKPNTHLEDPNLNVESLRESSDEERVLIFTCLREYGKCSVFCFWTKHNSQELSREETMVFTYVGPNEAAVKLMPCDLGTIERLERNPKVRNRLEVYPRDVYHVAMEEIMKYGGKVMLLPQQLEVYLGRRFRVAYEEAMKYAVQVVLCDKMSLKRKIFTLEDSLLWFDKLLDWIQSWTKK